MKLLRLLLSIKLMPHADSSLVPEQVGFKDPLILHSDTHRLGFRQKQHSGNMCILS